MIKNYGDLEKAQECLRETITLCEENDNELFLIYGALLVQMKQKKQALIFLTKVGNEESEPDLCIKAHLLMAMLYAQDEENDNQAFVEKHLSYVTQVSLPA